MEIRFISSLTAEDENRVAPALLTAVGALLDRLPIAYTIRIQTSDARVFNHTHSCETPATEPASNVEKKTESRDARIDTYIWGEPS